MPHAALRVVQQDREVCMPAVQQSFNAARGFAGGAANDWVRTGGRAFVFQCRTRLCGWCSRNPFGDNPEERNVSMPHAALWVVQPRQAAQFEFSVDVSMPHAALWVVQPLTFCSLVYSISFQCRTRLCGWCSLKVSISKIFRRGFQCRTRLCGWCSKPRL